MWTLRAIIIYFFVSQINAGPVSAPEKVTFLDFEDQNCSLNISAVLPNINDICKDVSSYDLSSSTESFNSKEKLCWAVHFHVKNMCHSGSTKLGNAVPPNGGVICNYLTNQWKNFTCETEATLTESKLCQEMLKMTSEETISNDCQDVCVKKVDNEMADGRICFSLYLAIQSSTPKLGENGHGLPPHKNLLGENGHGLPPQKMLLGSENRQDMPPKIDNNNEQKLDEYNIDDENEEDQGAQHSDEEQLSKSIVADEQPKQQSSIEEKSIDKSEIVHTNKTTTTQTIVKSDVESTTTKKTTIIHENTPVIDIKTQKSTVKTDENEISTTNVPDDKEDSNFVVTPKPNQPNSILPVPPSNNNALDSKNTNNEEEINGNSLLAEDHPQIQQNNPNLPQSPILDKMGDAALETQSKFFSYFVAGTIICIVGYIVFHNKKKIMALLVEGRRKQPSSRSRRHSSSAAYHKLDNNLEEAMGSNSNESVRHVIY